MQQQGPPPKNVEVIVSSMNIWQEKGIDNVVGKKIAIRNGKTVMLSKAYEEYTEVMV